MRGNRRGLSRRNVLRGASGIAVGLPFLELFSSEAKARPGGEGPQRMISFFHPQGMIMDAWVPTGTGSNYQLSEILQPLSTLNPATGNPLSEDIVVVSGLDNVIMPLNADSYGHPSAPHTLFTCQPLAPNVAPDGTLLPNAQQTPNEDNNLFAAGPSIEQVIAERHGQNTMYRSVDLSIGGRAAALMAPPFSAGVNDPIEPEDDPMAAFDRLFTDLDVEDPTPLQRIRAARGSVLDTVGESFNQLQSRVGAADRVRLEAHLDKIRELELQVGGGTPLGACGTPSVGGVPGYDTDSWTDVGLDQVAPQMIDMAVMALACDLTRVSTLQFTIGHDPRFDWLGMGIPGQWDVWHSMIHEARYTTSGRPLMIAAMQWYTEMFVYLLQQLASIPEGDGTMLDNTVVLWLSEFGDGDGHGSQNLPAVLAGNACGRIQTGQHLDHTDRSIGDLCTTILQAFGDDDASFGFEHEAYHGPTVTGPLEGILV